MRCFLDFDFLVEFLSIDALVTTLRNDTFNFVSVQLFQFWSATYGAIYMRMLVHLNFFRVPIHGWNEKSIGVMMGQYGDVIKCYNKMNKKTNWSKSRFWCFVTILDLYKRQGRYF